MSMGEILISSSSIKVINKGKERSFELVEFEGDYCQEQRAIIKVDDGKNSKRIKARVLYSTDTNYHHRNLGEQSTIDHLRAKGICKRDAECHLDNIQASGEIADPLPQDDTVEADIQGKCLNCGGVGQYLVDGLADKFVLTK